MTDCNTIHEFWRKKNMNISGENQLDIPKILKFFFGIVFMINISSDTVMSALSHYILIIKKKSNYNSLM